MYDVYIGQWTLIYMFHYSSEWRDRQGRECIHKVGQYFVRPSEQGGPEKEQEHEQEEEEGELED